MQLLKYIFAALLTTGICHPSHAQAPTSPKDSSAPNEKTHFIFGTAYNSAMNYYGRIDSLKSKAISPFIGLSLKNGIYFNSTFVFIHNDRSSEYAAALVEGGYTFTNKKASWTGSLSVTKFFYQANIDLVQSTIRQSAAATLTHLDKVLNISLTADAKLSSSIDYGVTAGLDHIVRIPHIFKNTVLVLDPSVNGYAGTRNYTKTYFEKKNFLFIPIAEQQVAASTKRFDILSYEASLPIVLAYKKLALVLIPSYVLPQNILAAENAANLFYMSATIKCTL